MVGRFVEHEEVAAAQEKQCKRKAAPFAAGKRFDIAVEIALAEHEEAEHAHEFFFRSTRVGKTAHFTEHSTAEVESFGLVLAVVAHASGGPHGHAASGTGQLAGKYLEQSRLAASIMPHQTDALTAKQREGQLRPQSRAVRELESKISRREHDLFGRSGFRPLEGKLLAFGLGLVLFQLLFQLLGLLLTRTGLTSLGGLGLEAADEVQLVGKVVCQLFGFAFALFLYLFLKFEELGVAALAEHRLGRAQIKHV